MMPAFELAFDFRSDTLSQPSPEMKQAMVDAPLGDDVYGEDPSVDQLQKTYADYCGFEAGLFCPTGSMANQTALMTHAAPGGVLYAGHKSHVKLYEMGAYARLGGLSLVEIDDSTGLVDLKDLKAKWYPDIYYMPKPAIITLENTHNMRGGVAIAPQAMVDIAAFAAEQQVPVHLDGARIFNAAIACGQPVKAWAPHVDSMMLSISKGLGAPVGSLLLGSQAFIEKARPIRKLLGGGLRQSGILAAAGLYALEHNLELLKRDHERAHAVFTAISSCDWLAATEPQTNILIFRCHEPKAVALVEFLKDRGLGILPLSANEVRVVFHLNNSDAATDALIQAILDFGGSL
jgi:threonine aldolase